MSHSATTTLRLPLLVLLAALVALAVTAQPAQAARGDQVIDDCAEDGVLDGDYSDADLREALRDIPADIDEYTECREVIERARRALRRNSNGSSDDAGGFSPGAPGFSVPGFNDPLSPSEEQGIGEISGGEAPEVDFEGERVQAGEPGGIFGQAAATGNELPLPLLLAMIATFLALALPTALRGRMPESLRGVAALPGVATLRGRLSSLRDRLSSLRRRG